MTLSLAAIGGITRYFDRVQERAIGDTTDLATIIVGGFFIGAIVGIVLLYITSAVLYWTGSWFGGQANEQHLKAAVAWSNVPLIPLLFIWLMLSVVYGNDLFSSSWAWLYGAYTKWVLLFFGIIGGLLNLYSLVILIRCVSEVQEFSVWKAFSSIAIPASVLFGFGVLWALATG